jgi:hypothetical protein
VDTLKILLGGTLALVIGALIVFAKQLNRDVADTPPDKLEAMQRQLSEMKREMERLDLEKERRILMAAADSPSEPSTPDDDTAEETRRVAELEARLAQIEAEAETAKEDAKRAEEEAELLTQRHSENRDNTKRRIRLINDAMVIATVQEWIENPKIGGFATLNIESRDNVEPGTVLALRRNGGVLGKFRVGEVTSGQAIGEPITAFDEAKPEPGDELILNQIVEMAK